VALLPAHKFSGTGCDGVRIEGEIMKKNIYVKDEDASIFEEAERLAGSESLSSIIASALKQYVEGKKAEEEIVLEVGNWRPRGANDTRKVAFKGRLLADGTDFCGQTMSRDDRGTDWAIYQTSKGKFLIYWKNWSRWENESDSADYTIVDELPEPDTTFIGDSGLYTESSGNIPASIVEDAAKALGQNLVKRLDI
jgi:hypothetical protein